MSTVQLQLQSESESGYIWDGGWMVLTVNGWRREKHRGERNNATPYTPLDTLSSSLSKYQLRPTTAASATATATTTTQRHYRNQIADTDMDMDDKGTINIYTAPTKTHVIYRRRTERGAVVVRVTGKRSVLT